MPRHGERRRAMAELGVQALHVQLVRVSCRACCIVPLPARVDAHHCNGALNMTAASTLTRR